jgi:hypothetical protein
MTSPRTALLIGLFTAGLGASLANAAAAPTRIRAVVTAATETSITIKSADGQTQTIGLTPGTKFAGATQATLGAVHAGEFIGTATKSVAGKMVALEVVIFPDSMRGTGEGHYGWDTINDTTARAATVSSSMTNGSVSMAMPARKTGSSMTNGNISADSGSGGGTQITVTYQGGEQIIDVPATAPVVQLAPATRSVLAAGLPVFIVAAGAHGDYTALRVIVGLNGAKLAM